MKLREQKRALPNITYLELRDNRMASSLSFRLFLPQQASLPAEFKINVLYLACSQKYILHMQHRLVTTTYSR